MLVCASSVSHDLGIGARDDRSQLVTARWTMLVIGAGATIAALLVERDIFSKVMFAWAALGSAFGPLVLVHVLRGPVAPGWALLAATTGAGVAIYGFRYPINGAGGFLDRVIAWGLALCLAWIGSRRRTR